MPLATFLIVIGSFVGLIGVFAPYLVGVEANPNDPNARMFIWLAVVSFPLLLGPAVIPLKYQRLTRAMSGFAMFAGGLLALLLLLVGMPSLTNFKVGYLLAWLGTMSLGTGGVMGWRDPPDRN